MVWKISWFTERFLINRKLLPSHTILEGNKHQIEQLFVTVLESFQKSFHSTTKNCEKSKTEHVCTSYQKFVTFLPIVPFYIKNSYYFAHSSLLNKFLPQSVTILHNSLFTYVFANGFFPSILAFILAF